MGREFNIRGHFFLEMNGGSLAYCYIRKNACTAFKYLFIGESPYEYDGGDILEFMGRHHKADHASLEGATHRICVLRNPAERAVSVFRNKFIVQRNNADIFSNYESITGDDPAQATFRDFVAKYVTKPTKSLDPHLWSQSAHLLPIVYDFIPMRDLRKRMAEIIGPELAEKYFAKKVNSSSEVTYDDDVSQTTAHELKLRYQNDKALPSTSSLCDAESLKILHSVYSHDFRLFQNL